MNPLLKIFIIFAGIVGINRAGLRLGLALLLAVACTGLWFGLPPGKIAVTALESLGTSETLTLMALVLIIFLLNNLMDKGGNLRRMVLAFSSIAKNPKISMVALPALIGMLPLPGGALFSAPMVEKTARNSLSADHLTAMNYWFRHLWEYWWPLYPGVALALTLTGLSPGHFFLLMFPFSVMAVLGGLFFIVRPVKTAKGEAATTGKFTDLVREAAPILIVIVSMLVLLPLTALAVRHGFVPATFKSGLPVVLSMFAGLVFCLIVSRAGAAELFSPLTKASFWSLFFTVAAVMAFKSILEQSSAVSQVLENLKTYHIPVLAVVMVMPFLTGLIVGLMVGLVGISFPIVLALVRSTYPESFMAYVVVAYTCGYIGMMISPVHICLVATNEYFHSDLLKVYRWLTGPVAVVFVTAVLLFLILK